MIRPKVPIALEGYPFIAICGFITLICAILGNLFLVFLTLLATAFTTYFFRDPERFTPDTNTGIISPADGKVILIEEIQDDTFTGNEAYKISIFMNVFNVHVNRVPMDGTVEKIKYHPGKFYSADSARGAELNEYCGTILTSKSGEKIAFVQIAGLIARRIICWLEPQDIVKKGSRFGLIRFGSRVDLYLPKNAKIEVTIGQKVSAGETIIADLK